VPTDTAGEQKAKEIQVSCGHLSSEVSTVLTLSPACRSLRKARLFCLNPLPGLGLNAPLATAVHHSLVE
jgi:hypothetical protein